MPKKQQPIMQDLLRINPVLMKSAEQEEYQGGQRQIHWSNEGSRWTSKQIIKEPPTETKPQTQPTNRKRKPAQPIKEPTTKKKPTTTKTLT